MKVYGRITCIYRVYAHRGEVHVPICALNLINLLIRESFAPDYFIREISLRGSNEAYEIAKFTRGSRPSAIYQVYRVGKSWRCTCPGFQRAGGGTSHKHIKLILAWKRKGKPDPTITPGFQDWVQSIL